MQAVRAHHVQACIVFLPDSAHCCTATRILRERSRTAARTSARKHEQSPQLLRPSCNAFAVAPMLIAQQRLPSSTSTPSLGLRRGAFASGGARFRICAALIHGCGCQSARLSTCPAKLLRLGYARGAAMPHVIATSALAPPEAWHALQGRAAAGATATSCAQAIAQLHMREGRSCQCVCTSCAPACARPPRLGERTAERPTPSKAYGTPMHGRCLPQSPGACRPSAQAVRPCWVPAGARARARSAAERARAPLQRLQERAAGPAACTLHRSWFAGP